MRIPLLTHYRFLLLVLICCFAASDYAYAQVKGMTVEKYYVSDSNDFSDTTGGRRVPVGSVTYRVFVEIEPGSSFKRIFGDSLHPLVVSSDSVFYNNNDRPSSEFGFELQSSWYEDNPMLALDSWLTIGLATRNQKGIMKSKDPDGGAIAGTNNLGGTAAVPGGLLVNADTVAGIPLTLADGLAANNQPQIGSTGWTDVGFKDAGSDTTVFGADSSGNEFYCTGCVLQAPATSGLIGAAADSTHVLLAQLTTKGSLAFKLNVTLEQPDGNGGTVLVDYVSTDDTIATTVVSPFLTYPQACGCTDPRYLEYSAGYSCLEQDSCKNLIRFGCTDSLACNYDPEANVNVASVCCYPGLCSDRNLSLACPELNLDRSASGITGLWPNPVSSRATLEFTTPQQGSATVSLQAADGRLVFRRQQDVQEGLNVLTLDVDDLPEGIYYVQIIADEQTSSRKLVVKR